VTVFIPFLFSSRQFGFLQLNAEEHANKKALVVRVIASIKSIKTTHKYFNLLLLLFVKYKGYSVS